MNFKHIAKAVLVPAAMIAALAGCSDYSNDYDAVCVDQVTGMRVDDSRCGEFNGGVYPGFYPYYYPVYVVAPAIGYPMTPGGYRTLPSNGRISKTRVPAQGGATNPKAAPKPAQNPANKPKSTYTQPPKGNGGAYKPPASAPKPAAPAAPPRPASPPKYK